MSLYAVQKFLFELNRSEEMQNRYTADRQAEVARFNLTDDEIKALFVQADVHGHNALTFEEFAYFFEKNFIF